MILQCTCKHAGQDQLNGPGKRVFNPDKNGEHASCSVCGASKGTGQAKTVAKKEKAKA